MSNRVQGSSGVDISPGEVLAERYEVVSRLGEGGMGVVFHAVDRQLDNQPLAIKVLHPRYTQDPEVFTRFRNEVLVSRNLAHPNIVRIYDFGQTPDKLCYISMEYVQGSSLNDRIEASRGLCCQDAISILRQIVDGVSYAHRQGVVHRDLKPANIMITKDDTVKLADFGTARVVKADTTLTQTGKIIGTPGYISPEQIRGERGSATSDIYALGIIAYELVTGRLPYQADSFVELAMKQLSEPIPSLPPELGIPAWYEALVHRCAAGDRKRRFDTVDEIKTFIDQNAVFPLTACRRRRDVLRRWLHSPSLLAGGALATAVGIVLIYLSGQREQTTNLGREKVASATSIAHSADDDSLLGLDAELELERRLRERQGVLGVGEATDAPRPLAPQEVAAAVLDRTNYASAAESKASALEALQALQRTAKR
ncbi:MAG: serine/threonine protein kinase [Bdellovibrionales bacterium]|nr:serine/threonine protein kinase [Bdellovibrionales bacterium]